MRLIGGNSSAEGRLEVLHDGQWGTVCDKTFYYIEAGVVCNSLGFGLVLFGVCIRAYLCLLLRLLHYGCENGDLFHFNFNF